MKITKLGRNLKVFLNVRMNCAGLCQTINKFLRSEVLDILDSEEQGYYGADAVANKDKGLQAKVCRVNPKALYICCSRHWLNLAVVASCMLPRLRKIMEQIK